ncbi:MAG: class I SAM-dependent methyltransferase [Candidatus Helarchaeota archaeon]
MEKKQEEHYYHNKLYSRKSFKPLDNARIFCINIFKELISSRNLDNGLNNYSLDIGGGTGLYSVVLSKEFKIKTIVNDISLNGLQIARKRFQKYSTKKNDNYIHADAEFLPIKENSLEIILFIASLHHLKLRKMIGICQKYLIKGGKLIILEPNGNNIFRRMFWRIGKKFKLISSEEHLLYARDVVKQLKDHNFKIISKKNLNFNFPLILGISQLSQNRYFLLLWKKIGQFFNKIPILSENFCFNFFILSEKNI